MINEQLKVRLIGMDTPETVKPNTPEQLMVRSCRIILKTFNELKDVYLEYDKRKRRRYGRTLAYVGDR